MNITLIGMPSAGKSYFGKQVAEKLGMDFFDSDEKLIELYGKPVQNVLDEKGEEFVLDTEARITVEETRNRDRLVISPGGSVVYRDEAMKHLKTISKVIYLKLPFERVEDRLRDLPPRGIIGLGKKTLRELYDEREPLYSKSTDFTIETELMTGEEVVEAIVEYIRKG